MDDLTRYYQILGLNSGASADELRQAYRDLVKVWHPDRFAHDDRLQSKAQEKLKEINGAYEVLRAAMFAAGADPGPQASAEPEPGPDDAAEPSSAEPGQPAGRDKVAWAFVGGLGVLVIILAALCVILLTTDWFAAGRHVVSASQTGSHGTTVPVKSSARAPMSSGLVLAEEIYATTDDFIVDIYHNGERVQDSQRRLMGETFGATVEKIGLTIRDGDWLVFNVVNDRLRWNAVYYFAAAGVKEDRTIGFTSELQSGNWSYCDDPRDVARFIAEPDFLSENRALNIERRWTRGDELMKQFVSGWDGDPVWGANRNTWIKFRAVAKQQAKNP